MHSVIDEFVSNVENNRYGIGFARELKKQIEKRFPHIGAENKMRRFANYLAPAYKGIHLEAENRLDETKAEISAEVFNPNDAIAATETESDQVDLNLSPTSQLRKKILARSQRTITESVNDSRLPPIEKEFRKYGGFSLPPKEMNILHWWKCHKNVLPLLAKLAKRVLTVPASSAKSERAFSTGGNLSQPKEIP